ncbi:hypothetical protein B0T25DRAFT_510773 [Lasiosphaeria hispida]|uniref:Tyrosinase copper-binding domain-containing protein n=1 Tax=Lasiosphaeria hispida TaxID=260671 RepID=A0AAJ0M8F5_9PEZI|nr:hypothetical protein B0T25DRAFT_510773 [Lasiosphaeria hispida]
MAPFGFSLLRLALLSCSVLSQHTPYDYGFDVTRHAKRAIATPLVVRGEVGGDVQLRQEIRQLEQDQDLWTLYILGTSLLQFTEQSSPTSWYSITGIHGIPHQTWGGVGPTPGNEGTGYCTHSSILFPTWHRPYLVLYEQVLYSIIQTIATWWPEGEQRDRYQTAATRFRIPYWDWAATPPSGESVLPLSVGGSPYVDVDGPSGVQRIANPLFSYTFKPLNATAFLQPPWNFWTATVRSPTTNDAGAQSNNSLVAMNFDQNQASLSQRLYILFSNYGNYSTFSNNAWIPLISNASYDSLESLHDTVHNLAGGGGLGQPNVQGGHMSYIPYSAFDPIFFLHHCMVDRIFAIWQELNPETWVVPQVAALPSYTTSKGQVQDSRTALTPFYASSDGTFWTSDTVRDYTRFGYTYAELASGPNKSRRARANVRTAVNRLYGTSSPASLFIKANKALGLRKGGIKRPQPDSATAGRFNDAAFVGGSYREWIANIHVKKKALHEPFAVHLFVGDAPTDPRSWALARNHVGTMGVFSTPSKDAYGMAMEKLDVSGTVPLTTALLSRMGNGELASLKPVDVEEYLRSARGLQVRVVGSSGSVYDSKKIKGLGVSIASSIVQAPRTEEELPVWGTVVAHFEMG